MRDGSTKLAYKLFEGTHGFKVPLSHQGSNYLKGLSRQQSNYLTGLSRQISFPYLEIWCTFISDFSLSRLFGRVVNALFGRRPSARQESRQRGPLDFRIQPILTLDERESPRTVSRPRFANQLSNDGATGLSVNQLGDLEDSRDDGFRQFGSTGVCRQNFHCSGSERCVKRNGEFM